MLIDGAGVRPQRLVYVKDGIIGPGIPANAPNTYNLATYYSGERVTAYEKWVIPSTDPPFRITDVRTILDGPPPLATHSNIITSGATFSESDVIGLIADLDARVIRGGAYAASRVAFINMAGFLDGIPGNPSDCVRVDGTSGPCGADGAASSDSSVIRSSGARLATAIPIYDATGALVSSQCSIDTNGLFCSNGGESGSVLMTSKGSAQMFSLTAPDNLSSSVCLSMPSAKPIPGQVLAATAFIETRSD